MTIEKRVIVMCVLACVLATSTCLPCRAAEAGTKATTAAAALDWKDSWQFVQGDKAVQYRLAKVREQSPHTIFRIQYRVNSSDPIYAPTSHGYHLYRRTDDSQQYRVEFPADFVGVDTIYELPIEIALFVDGENVVWDADTNTLVYNNPAYSGGGYASCADDNSAASRCETYYQFKRDEISQERQFTAGTK